MNNDKAQADSILVLGTNKQTTKKKTWRRDREMNSREDGCNDRVVFSWGVIVFNKRLPF